MAKEEPVNLTTRSTLSSPVDPAEMLCVSCRKPFRNPKILPCAHLICHDCLVSHIMANAKEPEGVSCPRCYATIVGPREQSDRTCEEVAEGLPTDLAMAALVDCAFKLERQHNVCLACQAGFPSYVCLNCGDLLCKVCAAGHLNMSFARNHTVEELEQMTAEQLSTSRPITCSAHDNEPCRFFCRKHGLSICNLCAAARHKNCPEVVDLEQTLNEAYSMLASLLTRLIERELDLDNSLAELDKFLKQTEEYTKMAVADIDAACDRLVSAVEACRSRTKDTVLTFKADAEATVAWRKAFFSERRDKVVTHRRLVERVKWTAPRATLAIMTSALRSRVSDLEHSLALPDYAKDIAASMLTVDPMAIKELERGIKELGEFGPLRCLQFHPNHGKHIKLSKTGRTATRVKDRRQGLVVSLEQMISNRLYEARVDKVDRNYRPRCYVMIGVITASPTEHNLSLVNGTSLQNACVVWDTHVMCRGQQVKSDVGAALASVDVGCRVGVMLDDARTLHLFVDGRDQGIIAFHVPKPCHALFDLWAYWKKITGLPIVPVPKTS